MALIPRAMHRHTCIQIDLLCSNHAASLDTGTHPYTGPAPPIRPVSHTGRKWDVEDRGPRVRRYYVPELLCEDLEPYLFLFIVTSAKKPV